MAYAKIKLPRPGAWPSLCLVCGVDSRPIRIFLFVFMGALVLTSLCTLAWAFGTRRIDGEEEAARLAIEAETRRDG